MKRIALLTTLAAVSAGLAGCDAKPGICEGSELGQVQTSAEEAEAMQRFRDECRPLSMRAYDATGQAVPFSDDTWMTRVHRLELSGAGKRLFEHAVLEGKNVALLMGE